MRYGKLVIISTVVAFMLVVSLCLIWLFKVTETEITVSGEETSSVYDFEEKALWDLVGGKSILFLSEDKIKSALEENPYAEVENVKKVFPNKISVKIKKRTERFAYRYEGVYYFTDENFVLIRSGEVNSDKKIITVDVVGAEFDFANSPLGKKLDFSSNDILNYTVETSNAVEDKFNLIGSIKVDGEKNRIYLDMVTGACIEYRFAYPAVTATKEQRAQAERLILSFAEDAFRYYLALSESEKSEGYVLCYLTAGLSVKIEYTLSEPS